MNRSMLLVELEHIDGLAADLDDRRTSIINQLSALKALPPKQGNMITFPNSSGITVAVAEYKSGPWGVHKLGLSEGAHVGKGEPMPTKSVKARSPSKSRHKSKGTTS